MRVDLLASERHFLDHLAPIWRALPMEHRGQVLVRENLLEHARGRGIEARGHAKTSEAAKVLKASKGLVLVASFRDYDTARTAGRRIVFAEHGAGQSYSSQHTSYAGGASRADVALFLVPGDDPAGRNRRAHPRIKQAVIGCPKLDSWHLRKPKRRARRPVVAISFHWDCMVCPETRSAWSHYRGILAELAADKRWTLLGHGHPRILEQLRPVYQQLGIKVVTDFDQVLEEADLYVVDNSSTLFEFASVDRPVVVMNCPLYRRSVRHGLRFWDAASVGPQVEQPGQLAETIAKALGDPPEQQAARRRAVAKVYKFTDGQAARRAAEAILEVLSTPDTDQSGGKPVDSPRMVVDTTYVGLEGYVHPGAEVYPGYRREGQRWRRLGGVGIPQRRAWLENRRFAHLEPEPPVSGGTEHKRTGPSESKG